MRRFAAPFAFAFLSAALVVGCMGSRGSQGGSGNATTLEDDYLSTVGDMQGGVAWYDGVADPAATIGAYYDRMNPDLSRLADLYGQMQGDCTAFSQCPAGGGMTGHRDGSCMMGGHMMDAGEMSQMHSDWQSCRDALDQYWNACGTNFGADCTVLMHDHINQMTSFLDQMDNDCQGWWDQGDDMMGGNRWGNCNGDQQHGGMQ